jgi:hypothetical protein
VKLVLKICKSTTQYTEILCTVQMEPLNHVGQKNFGYIRFQTCIQFTTIECIIIEMNVTIRRQSKTLKSSNLWYLICNTFFNILVSINFQNTTQPKYELWPSDGMHTYTRTQFITSKTEQAFKYIFLELNILFRFQIFSEIRCRWKIWQVVIRCSWLSRRLLRNYSLYE